MQEPQSNIEKVIFGLQQAKEGIPQLIGSSHPMLSMRCEHTLGTLIGQLTHATGIVAGNSFDDEQKEEKKPSHFFGIPLGKAPEPVKQAAISPTDTERSQLQDLTNQAFVEFQTMEPAVLKETYGDLIIRAVAVKAGMDVTPTNPEKINVAFIRDVIAAVKVKAEQMAQSANADEAAKNSVDAAKEETANPDGGKTTETVTANASNTTTTNETEV